MLSFLAVVMSGSVSTRDTASDEILFPEEWGLVGSHICSTGILGL